MRALVRPIVCGITTVVMMPATLSASDPMDGTWDLDVSASKFNPGPGRTRDTRTYKIDGDRIQLTGTVVYADGRVETIQFEAALDGKDYAPTGNPRVETIAQVRVDTHTVKNDDEERWECDGDEHASGVEGWQDHDPHHEGNRRERCGLRQHLSVQEEGELRVRGTVARGRGALPPRHACHARC